MDKLERPDEELGCPEWREAISAMADGEGVPSEQQRVWQHLRQCASCRAYYRQLQALRHRLNKTNWAALWAQTLRENRRLRHWLLAAIVLTALFSVGVTVAFVRRLWHPPVMTPMAAIGLFQHHLNTPPEWVFSPYCLSGAACLLNEKAKVTPVQFVALNRWGKWEQAGICQCLGCSVVLYRLTVNDQPVMLLQFNINGLPLQISEGERFSFNGRPLHCVLMADKHLLFWQEGQSGLVLIAPSGTVNPFVILQHIVVP